MSLLAYSDILNIGHEIDTLSSIFPNDIINIVLTHYIRVRLQSISEDQKNLYICTLAVRSNPMQLYYVPQSIITQEMCLRAVKDNPHTFQWIPDSMKTKEVLTYGSRSHLFNMREIDSSLLSEEMCKNSITKSYHNFSSVPDHLITEEICTQAVAQGLSLMNIPRKHQTYNVFVEACKFKQHPESFTNRKVYATVLDYQDNNRTYLLRKWF